MFCSCLQEPGLWEGYFPKNGKLIFTQNWMTRDDAYEKGIEKIMQDPHHNICRITYWLLQGYSLQCWRVSDDEPIVFEKNLESIVCSSVSCFLNGRTLFLDEGKKKYTLRATLRPLVSVTSGSGG